ncbi:MAG: hypothetical protein BWX62_00591 [Bacteroidetes bacterium ADurb.Bin037]|nr:MAG: hypothetical protein BWX62_00591 [Bacteroidetes bacterium ADurb.Bin037]
MSDDLSFLYIVPMNLILPPHLKEGPGNVDDIALKDPYLTDYMDR